MSCGELCFADSSFPSNEGMNFIRINVHHAFEPDTFKSPENMDER
jgi:hypothetical protein